MVWELVEGTTMRILQALAITYGVLTVIGAITYSVVGYLSWRE